MNTKTYRYQKLVEKYFKIGIQNGPEWMCNCLWHDNTGTPALQINVESGLYVCFSCDARGNGKTLLKYFNEPDVIPEVDMRDLRTKLKSLEGDANFGEKKLPSLSESILKRYTFPFEYWKQRGFNDKTIDTFDLGYDVMNDMGTIGLRNHAGELIGFIKRDMDPNCIVKYKNPKGFKRSDSLFGSWLADKSTSDLLVVCEGPVDAMMVWQAGYPAVAQFGSSISPAQIRLIRRMGFGQVVLFYDNDKPGRKATAYAKGLRIHARDGKETVTYDPRTDLRRDFVVSSVRYGNVNGNDPGSLTRPELRKLIGTAAKLM